MEYKGVRILFEDNHIIVVGKPIGLLSQKDKTGDDSIIEILKEYIKIKYNKPGNVFLGSVHRLDRPTSGVMVFARTSKALSRLTIALKEKAFSKKYYAILEGKVGESSGKLVHYLLKNTRSNVVNAYKKEVKGSKKSILEYNNMAVIDGFSLLDIHLLTGRSHQIRAQLSTEFYPIYGDKKYGGNKGVKDRKICLHCYSLSFIHPVKKEPMSFNLRPDKGNCIWNVFNKNFK